MEGFDKEWQYIGIKREAIFTNLNPGTYTFKVIASNNDGLWNTNGPLIKVVILPPFWKTWWFRMTLVIILIMSTIFWSRYKIYSIKLRNERLEKIVKIRTRQLEEQKTENERMAALVHEADQNRIRFLTNISHEFRTPLTLIINPIEKILAQISDNQEIGKLLMLISRNSKNLLNLINQILDIQKIETNNMGLEVARYNISQLLQDIYSSFLQVAEKQEIIFELDNQLTIGAAWFDAQKIERILINLLSNAFKFTSKFGTIKLQAHLINNDDWVRISVTDTGIGIPEDKVSIVFDRFTQIKNPKATSTYGTGIGLNLARELAEMHHGSLNVTTVFGKGSTFWVDFPITKEAYNQLEITEEKYILDIDKTIISSLGSTVNNDFSFEDGEEINPNKNKPTILFAEDNNDLRYFIKQNLKDIYNIHLAEDGEAGFTKAIKFLPDLIISDISMPKTDGIEFCTNIKSEPQTCHIPFILLTSRSNVESQIKGLEFGADDYITKPFNLEILKVRIKNLIHSRKMLKERFSKEVAVSPSEITISPLDEKFLQKAIEIIENNITSTDLDVEVLSSEMFLGRRQMYNKIKALTDLAPSDFIRLIRLKRAAWLILSGMNVSEAAYDSGFTDPKYFSKCFKKQFGITPSDYSKKF